MYVTNTAECSGGGAWETKVAEVIVASRRHPEESYKTILGIIRLGEMYGQQRLESACMRALEFNTTTYKSIKNILVAGLDKTQPPKVAKEDQTPISHENIRGPEYYN